MKGTYEMWLKMGYVSKYKLTITKKGYGLSNFGDG